ncbi:FliM/FliN family flagellar motor switch protein [Loktanella sp. Alg231-35]|uniref:FliM/FliN family flagellar motor switch protein n=1 Tax=Loktanella sp. Alg231-35 TaxID=1922220 RepID=UPI000D54E701|nr:FliM/FliN family flagellar motor switch protein [Loktanella sp. Alg231-35]
MTDTTQATLLRRMIRPQTDEGADNPLTSSRAARLALTKSADSAIGLVLTVTSGAEETATLDDMLGALSDDLLLIGLGRAGTREGLVSVDLQLRAAIVEMQTVGALIDQPATDRAPTLTDCILSEPLLTTFLTAFPAAVIGTPLEGWADGVELDDRFKGVRSAGLMLTDCKYRIVRMNVDLGVAERQGQIVIALPLVETAAPEVAVDPDPVDWDATFLDTVQAAPATLEAQLHRFTVPLATIQGLTVNQVLPLPGCTVDTVQLRAVDGGATVAVAKLGQLGGMRAVRLQPAPPPQLTEFAQGAVQEVPDLLSAGGYDGMDTSTEPPTDMMINAIDADVANPP